MSHVDGSEPYPWPYDGDLSGERLALVVAGWDHEWSQRADAPSVETILADLAAAVLAWGGLVVTVAHRGAAALSPLTGSTSVTADGLDAFHGGPLDGQLRRAGRTNLLVAGHGLEGPVHSTMRSANDRGYECLLVVDACAVLCPDLVEAAINTVHMSGGIFGASGRSPAIRDALAPTLTVPVKEAAP